MSEIIWDTLSDGVKLFPFLLITYLIMEYIEHKTGRKTRQVMKKAGKWGPAVGGLLGIVPQCGFSAAASNLYAGRIITLGTLAAVFLSTSDEMLPIMISEQVSPVTIAQILLVKVIIGVLAGFIIDFLIGRKTPETEEELRIGQICDHERCHCTEEKIFKSAVKHTFQIFLFILLISFLLNCVIALVGEDVLAAIVSKSSVLGPMLAALIGLIPNCASSIILTQLYLEGVLGAGTMMAGLLAGSGVGLLILYRVNEDMKENVKITVLVYLIGAVSGIVMGAMGI